MFPVFQAANGGSETACHALGVTQQVSGRVGRAHVCWAPPASAHPSLLGSSPHLSRPSCLSGLNSVLQPGLPGGCRPPLAWKPAHSPGPSLGEDERVSRRACGPLEVGERRPGPGGPIPRRESQGTGPGPQAGSREQGPSPHPTPDLRAPPPCRACLLCLIQQLRGVSAAFRRLGSFL